ncbi:MAG TPA: N,N-dimethylformamidase beta subunit family domain-containing protein, partial [Pedococcus sp.]|nr:N,N-dimethylformamidase beta subunit family domain-containing protein [Pedococcus sp.]
MRRLGLDRSRMRRALLGLVASAVMALGSLAVLPAGTAAAANPCGPPVVNVIACENTQTGDPTSDWQITGSGSSTIQGFATSISVSPGDTVQFKINTPSKNYHFDILRMGYYQGNGARKIAGGLKPSVALPQTQPACLNDPNPTGLIDCGNWGVSASWTVPTTAVSGVYIAHLVRDDVTGASSHIVFIVRNDSSHSDILFQTDDETWQAYNTYGGNSLYSCTVACPPGNPGGYKGAYKVSYNRPFHTALDDQGRSWLMYSEYPMIRWLESNGY